MATKRRSKLRKSCRYGRKKTKRCGRGKPKSKPAGPHLITKADLKEKIVNIIKKYQ